MGRSFYADGDITHRKRVSTPMATGRQAHEGQGSAPLRPDDPAQVGPWRLAARLGAGGMGQVFVGIAPDGTRSAVKVIHPERSHDPEFRQRFRREIAAALAVRSSHTARVLGADPDAPLPWLATELVPGPSLADAVAASGPLPEPVAWQVAAGIVAALRTIHDVGLVHRDLKPSNILLAADGPRVIDFGIAHALEQTTLTATGAFIGTPGYVSPEQAVGTSIGPASDIFSLGCVICYMVTGAAPFGHGTADVILYRVAHEEPCLDGLDGDLRVLVQRCLAKDPASRPTVAEVAAACLRDVPPESAPGGEISPGAGFPHAIFPDTITVSWPRAVSSLISVRESQFRQYADTERARPRDRPVPPPRGPRVRPPFPGPPPGRPRPSPRRVRSGLSVGVGLIAAAAVLGGGIPLGMRLWAEHFGWPPKAVAVLHVGKGDSVTAVQFAGQSSLSAASYGGTATTWNLTTKTVSGTPLETAGRGSDKAIDPAGHLLATTGTQGTSVTVLNTARRTQVAQFGFPVGDATIEPGGTSCAFSPDGHMLACDLNLYNLVPGQEHAIFAWDLRTRRQIDNLLVPQGPGDIHDLAFSPDGKLLAFYDGTKVVLLNLATHQVRRLPSADFSNLGTASLGDNDALAFSPDGTLIAGGDATVTVWRVATGAKIASFSNPPGIGIGAAIVAISPDEKVIAFSNGGAVHFWNIASHRQIAYWSFGKFTSTLSIAFSPTWSLVAVGTDSGSSLVQGSIVVLDAPKT